MNHAIRNKALEVGLSHFQGQPNSRVHGAPHWQNVYENALQLCWMEGLRSQTSYDFFAWFAFLHDCKRENDDRDPLHGFRAAELAKQLQANRLIELSDLHQVDLQYALSHHSAGLVKHENILVRICWDADRLDLPRVGVIPHVARMSTDAGKHLAMTMFR